MSQQSRLGRLVILASLAVIGTATAHDMSQHTQGTTASVSRTAACNQPVPSCAISLTPAFGNDGALRVIYSVAGRVYVARNCLPCMVEMPRLAAFSRDRPNIDFVYVAADRLAQSERITSHLTRFGLAEAKAFVFADDFVERLRFEADKAWHGELPFTLLIAPDGRTQTHLGEIDAAILQHWRANGD